MQPLDCRYDESDILSRLKYEEKFDRTLNHVALEAFGENDIVSGLLVLATYPNICRRAAARAGMIINVNPYVAVKIYLSFEAIVFDRSRSFIDRILRKKKDIEKIHVAMCTKAFELYMDADTELMQDWAQAYTEISLAEFNKIKGSKKA